MNLSEPLQPHGPLPTGIGHALQPGDMLEDFEITQLLGLTHHGVLYLAKQAGSNDTVAIKEYLPSGLALRGPQGQIELIDPNQQHVYQRGLESFVSEALTLSRLAHPHLLQVRCVWEGHGTGYRAMPHLAGTSLQTLRSSSHEPATQAQLQALFDGLLGALETLHDAGFAHGLISPTNVFMQDNGQPVLMDFGAVHQALLSDVRSPYIDAYADPVQAQYGVAADLRAVAAVLHFAIGGNWPPQKGAGLYEPVAEALKDSASALGYLPEFLHGIDAALTSTEAVGSVAAFRRLFGAAPLVAPPLPPPPQSAQPAPSGNRSHGAPAAAPAESDYPLNASDSVLALLAGFEQRPRDDAGIEPFESPAVPTLTEEAEPALPPMRASLFDAMDAGDPLPYDGVGYGRAVHAPMARAKLNRWRRLSVLLGVAALAVVCLGALAWHLLA